MMMMMMLDRSVSERYLGLLTKFELGWCGSFVVWFSKGREEESCWLGVLPYEGNLNGREGEGRAEG